MLDDETLDPSPSKRRPRSPFSSELQATLTILLESLNHPDSVRCGRNLSSRGRSEIVRAHVGYPSPLEMSSTMGLGGEVIRTGQSRLAGDVAREPAYVDHSALDARAADGPARVTVWE